MQRIKRKTAELNSQNDEEEADPSNIYNENIFNNEQETGPSNIHDEHIQIKNSLQNRHK